ncbi:hypothetical protein [Pedobacter frigidisoli]|uniref:hypothetical protein n=1 Tax=Pedobacter frigidisoli TaxID=2530455 RepID=UPI00292CEF4E|nr:hypothetical protein [Pedobacter frigidisoli]
MRNITILIILLSLGSCKLKNPSAEQVDNDLHIQVMKQVSHPDSISEYRVRIFTKKEQEKSLALALNKQMQFYADSLFYLTHHGSETYPDMVIPVSTSVANCYEYVLLFSPHEAIGESEPLLIYHDKYINGKTYTLRIKQI